MNGKPMSKRGLLRWTGGIAVLLGVAALAAGMILTWPTLRDLGILGLVLGGVWLLFSLFTRDEPLRAPQRRYVREFFPAIVAYVVILFSVWPMLQHVHTNGLRVLIALLPVLPIVFVVRAMVRLVLASDELERRIQLQAISVASLSVGLVSLALGFMAAAGVVLLKNALVLVLPAMFAVYGIAVWWIRRGYDGGEP
ncbi:hypothetical protein [Oleiagrimonas soli]|uniref:UDP-N-acetylmuramyl pentapeptide phosphotransferase/UDP-N-acetylglucosamine-1-phosphate transferase n=1 Tax=Oleiagrimonas soli TaxID=1543381 RepID=A0A841KH93_9GAMM|nr:hypothetical protein [Oleiagrimonas soli]MBB6184546.1 UDP-N-acetylmuramyl pentapeptide phosphotransferase/UDP-N-acetylglucosamine-1-phosphate transferase [Oleiagrimonas soli]